MNLPDLATLTSAIRDIAYAEILPRFEKVGFSVKADGSFLTEADLMANQRIQDYLYQHWPDIAFLSEEMEESEQEKLLNEADALWCLDPLDGTSNFIAGFPLFAVSLSLFVKGEVTLALTYDPIRDEAFIAQRGQGAWLNGQRLNCQSGGGLPLRNAVAIVDFKRLSAELRQRLLEQSPYASQRNLGTSALEWAWMAAGRGHVYLHGGMKLWDLAAGTLLLSEAGGYACTLQGESVFRPALAVRSVVISQNEQLFNEWKDFLKIDPAVSVAADN